VVVELGLDSLLPLAPLVDQRVAQPDLGAQLLDMGRRDPRLRHPPCLQQLAQPAGVVAVGLGPLLRAAQDARLRRLGQAHPGADRLELLDHEAPAGRRLQRRLDLRALPAAQPAPESEPVGRPDPAPAHLAGRGVERVERDLVSVLVKSHYDPHQGPPQAPPFDTCADHPRLS
jgi:hypothetical protein